MSEARGGAPVGHLADLAPIEAGGVLYLRLWSQGPEVRAMLCEDLIATLGPDHGGSAFRALSDICDLCERHGRRPIRFHDVGCDCLGADECCFAHLIAAAGSGQSEEARLFASLLVRADFAPFFCGLAEVFGLALRRMGIRSSLGGTHSVPAGTTLH